MPPPNILLITAARWRWDVLGAAGHPDIHTPNLDALAQHGQRFSQCWSTVPHGQHPAMPPFLDLGGPAEKWVHHLRAADYRSIFTGAWDFSGTPEQAGFETAVCVGGGPGGPGYAAWLAAQGRPDPSGAEASPTYLKSFGAMRSNGADTHHVTTWIGNQAVRAVQHASAPLFLWTHFNRPGLPYDPPAPWDGRYHRDQLALPADLKLPTPAEDLAYAAPFDQVPLTEARLRRALAFYYASISQVDHQIGRILATLAARGKGNTVIVFSAVAGEAAGQHGLVAAPRAPYESNLRVPLIVAGLPPARSPQAAMALVQLEDLAPTLLEIAGQVSAVPSKGRSLLPLLRGEVESHRPVLTARTATGWAVRNHRYKCCTDPQGDVNAAWDLESDPGEFHPLPIDSLPEADRAQLLAGLQERRADA